MIRTQVQITEGQQESLRAISAATGRSIADLIREGVDHVVAENTGKDREQMISRAIAAAGKFASGHRDVSSRHDRHLAEIYR